MIKKPIALPTKMTITTGPSAYALPAMPVNVTALNETVNAPAPAIHHSISPPPRK